MNAPVPRSFTFGDFRIDAVARSLRRLDGTPVVLTSRVFDTLLYLVTHPGTSLGKDELLSAIWPGRVVEENNLTQSISTLRKVLGTDTDGNRYIVTESGRGYRFAVDVRPVWSELDASPARVDSAGENPGDNHAAQQSMETHASRESAPRRPPYRMALAGVLLVGFGIAVAWFARHRSDATSAAPATTVAVLPFKPLLPNDGDEVLELGMADTLIGKLSSNRHLIVRSLSSVRKFSGLNQDPIEAARELDVGSVLEGQVQRRADHVHVNVRLLRVPDGAALWTGAFDENITDVFALQDTIAQKVAIALAHEFDQDERRTMRAGYTGNVDAYLLYLQGRYRIGKVTPTDIHAGMDSFRKAIDLDPTFASAYAALAEAYRRLPITSDANPKDAFPLAKASAQKALEIDPELAEAHSVLGWVAFWYEWNWPGAEKEFRRAIALNPSVAEAHLGYAHLLSNTGRNAEAVEQGRLARELDPLSPLVNTITATFLANAHRGPEAKALVDKVLEVDPDFWVAHLMRGGAALGAKNYPAAIAEFTRARDHSGGSMQAISMLGYALAQSGDRLGAQAVLDSLLNQVDTRYVPATSVATVYVALGDNDNAMKWLERAYDERDVRMTFLKVDDRWNPLRADPRFVDLARRTGLP
jgi:DNA-binding winged helix-turn-helix (wHTH) protein/TolB-like protein/Tfp pilus assembly protein PilF